MTVLDEEVGEGRWVMALTGDHGALTMPEYLVEEGDQAQPGHAGGFRPVRETFRALSGRSRESPRTWPIRWFSRLEQTPLCGRCPECSGAHDATSGRFLRGSDEEFLSSGSVDRWFRKPGFRCGLPLCGGLLPLLLRHRGTGHGTPYYYDRHVPLIFFGAGGGVRGFS